MALDMQPASKQPLAVSHSMDIPDAGPAFPRDLLLRVLSFLPRNALALSGRLVCKDAAQHFSQPQHLTVYLSQPLPPTNPAIACALDKATQGVTSLSFRRQLMIFCTAAASGSEANLNVVLHTLQPRVLPELLSSSGPVENAGLLLTSQVKDPGVSAAEAGHPHLLPWLLSHCPGLVDPAQTLLAMARHCSLGALQQAWQELQGKIEQDQGGPGLRDGTSTSTGTVGGDNLWQGLLDAAAECVLPEGGSKLEWVLQEGAGRCHVRFMTLAGAVRSGDVGRVKWLVQGRQGQQLQCQEQGQEQQDQQEQEQQQQLWAGEAAIRCILDAALHYADLGLVEWLVDEGGCPLPNPDDSKACHTLWWSAAASGEVSKLRWLEGRGLPVMRGAAVRGAASGGHLGLLQQLVQEVGNNRDERRELLDSKELSQNAVVSGCVRTTKWLLQQGCPTDNLCAFAMLGGCKDLVLLTARETLVSVDSPLLKRLIRWWPDGSVVNDLEMCEVLEALVTEHGGQAWLHGLPLCAAVERGNLPLVHKVLSLGQEVLPLPPPTDALLEHAADGGCGNVLVWLDAIRAGGAWAGWSGGGGNALAAVVKPWPWRALVKALVRGDLATAGFLVGHGVDVPPEALAMATEDGCALRVLQWLVGQGVSAGPGEASRALQLAVEGDVRSWLRTLAVGVGKEEEEEEEAQGQQRQWQWQGEKVDGEGKQGEGDGGMGEGVLMEASCQAVGEAESEGEGEKEGEAGQEGEEARGEGEGERPQGEEEQWEGNQEHREQGNGGQEEGKEQGRWPETAWEAEMEGREEDEQQQGEGKGQDREAGQGQREGEEKQGEGEQG